MEKITTNMENLYRKVELDEKDKKILAVLETNARLPISEIAKKTRIQRDSVLYRIKRMQKLNVIKLFHTTLNTTALGHPVYSFVNLMLQNVNQDDEKKMVGFFKEHPNIVYAAKMTGKWDFTINVAAKNFRHFDNIMTEIRMKFSGLIRDYEASSIIEEYKYDQMSGLI